MPSLSDDTPATETLLKGLLRQKYANGRITAFTLLNMDNLTVDRWVDECVLMMQLAHEKNEILLILQDLSLPHIVQTPYSRQRGQVATNAYPDLKGRVAYVLPPSTAAERIKNFFSHQRNQARERQAFLTREEALAWLAEWL